MVCINDKANTFCLYMSLKQSGRYAYLHKPKLLWHYCINLLPCALYLFRGKCQEF